MQGTFQQVLDAAVDDMLEHGFDSMERVEAWKRELQLAAERSLVNPASLQQMMTDGLTVIYKRMVDQGRVAKFNPGVQRYTLERIRPQLRGELDRRIMASADLIKLNRSQAIEKTLQRFTGWSTSIPKGGTSEQSRREVRAGVKKSMGQLPFEERRVLIDQGHKLTAAISEIVANDGGAIAGRWRSNWRQPGYNYREPHRDRDQQVYLVRDSWAHRAGLVKKGPAGYVDGSTKPGEEVFCRCWYVWIYNVRDLPPEMLTAKGKAQLAGARARADDAALPMERITKAVAEYRDGPNNDEHCLQCAMFKAPGRCTLVRGIISPEGWCEHFDIATRADDAPVLYEDPPWRHPQIVDRDHDVVRIAAISRDGRRLYVDRTVARTADIDGKRVDPAELLLARELVEWQQMCLMRIAFLDKHQRQPTPLEIEALQRLACDEGVMAERAAAGRLKISWVAWQAWTKDQLERLRRRDIARPPPDRGDLIAA